MGNQPGFMPKFSAENLTECEYVNSVRAPDELRGGRLQFSLANDAPAHTQGTWTDVNLAVLLIQG